MSVSKRLRYEVMRRDAHSCRYCGAEAPDATLTIDHVIPVALGGTDEAGNLVTACRDCNAGKSSSSPDARIVAGVSDDALRWAAAMRRAAEIQDGEQEKLDLFCERFAQAWGEGYSLPADWRNSVQHWYSVGAGLKLLLDCMDIAFAARGVDWRWKYYCGIVWRRIGERQQIASELIAQEEREPAVPDPAPWDPTEREPWETGR